MVKLQFHKKLTLFSQGVMLYILESYVTLFYVFQHTNLPQLIMCTLEIIYSQSLSQSLSTDY